MRPLYVTGTSFWAPKLPSLEHLLSGDEDDSAESPPCAIASSRLLRGTSLVTKMLVDCAAVAGQAAAYDLGAVPTVFGSMFGEIDIALMQLEMMRTGDGIVSPARFKNSVHNTGAGVFSIATENHGFTTAIAGGWQTVPVCLLEAALLLDREHEEAIVAVADEPPPHPLDLQLSYAGLGVGLALSTRAEGALARLSNLRVRPDVGRAPWPEHFDGNPCAPAVTLVEAIARGREGTVALVAGDDDPWAVDVALPR